MVDQASLFLLLGVLISLRVISLSFAAMYLSSPSKQQKKGMHIFSSLSLSSSPVYHLTLLLFKSNSIFFLSLLKYRQFNADISLKQFYVFYPSFFLSFSGSKTNIPPASAPPKSAVVKVLIKPAPNFRTKSVLFLLLFLSH